ncbi:MAG: ZIP family metal transporter [Trueperaceae bacterium]
MDAELLRLLLITFVAAVVADLSMVLGVAPFFFLKDLSKNAAATLSAVAAGMMAAASLVQLVGEGLRRTTGLQVWEVAAGIVLGALFYGGVARWVKVNDTFNPFGLRATGGAAAVMIVAAMTAHSLPEGIAIGVAFGSGEAGFGIAVVSALAVHNVPEAIAITLALRAKGLSVWQCMGWALVTSVPQPLAAPFAAWLMWLFEPLLPFGLGFAAGAMLFLVVDDLLPEALEEIDPTRTAAAFTGGAVGMIVLGRFVGL